MKMVQEQRLRLNMKFFLGYNMKIVIVCVCVCVCEGDKNLVEAFSLVEEDYPRLVLIMDF